MLRPPEADAPSTARVGGLLAAYVVVHGILILHGLGLTLAAVIVNTNPALAGLDDPKPWSHIAFYVVTNVVLAVYSAALIRLILTRRRSAIVHNAIWAILTFVLLVTWHVLGMKSLTGVVVDSLPGLVGMLYLARSSRAKQTLVTSRVSCPSCGCRHTGDLDHTAAPRGTECRRCLTCCE